MAWQWVHRWSSLVCTIFLLLICVTGLPLIFSHEIDDWLTPPQKFAELPASTPNVSLDRLAGIARKMYPGQIISSMRVDDDEPQAYVWMAPTFEARRSDPESVHFIRFDVRTAQVLGESDPPGSSDSPTFLGIMLRLHANLFAGLPGALFMGLMGLLFIVALVSGVALYGPFTRKLDFGTIRTDRRRARWIDLHNLIGIVALAWALVVGATGIMNELAAPLVSLWQRTDVKAMLAPYSHRGAISPFELASPQVALDNAKAVLPGMVITSVYFPGHPSGSPYHFVVWAKGSTPLTERLTNPMLMDGRTGRFAQIVEMPWYLRALEVSRPLHFGDYGGLPLKIIWALLDLVTIVVLGSGLYLWIARPRRERAAAAREGLHGASPAMEPAE